MGAGERARAVGYSSIGLVTFSMRVVGGLAVPRFEGRQPNQPPLSGARAWRRATPLTGSNALFSSPWAHARTPNSASLGGAILGAGGAAVAPLVPHIAEEDPR